VRERPWHQRRPDRQVLIGKIIAKSEDGHRGVVWTRHLLCEASGALDNAAGKAGDRRGDDRDSETHHSTRPVELGCFLLARPPAGAMRGAGRRRAQSSKGVMNTPMCTIGEKKDCVWCVMASIDGVTNAR
jgi:hypothetical protein